MAKYAALVSSASSGAVTTGERLRARLAQSTAPTAENRTAEPVA